MMKLSRTTRLLTLLAVLAWSPFALADEAALWSLLQGGGQVVLIRHALTTAGVGDPPGMTLADCNTQRNLNEEGRAQARQLGVAWHARGVAVGRLLSSPWCRCVETARLAFGQTPELASALGNLFDHPERVARQLTELTPLVSQTPARGNTVLMSHGSTIQALTGISPATAEMVVLTPQGSGGFTVAGRLSARSP
ncbi:histidine phosphatase family protein [Rhodoferax ferrireducens]|uniref:histidine phosphatase family protein n=1 Tax=Rhodoferax ferrireducens TaxID=192843 RepID=UPI0013001AB3|nr:histidine phosphatase family protein [Rhodoferax ferrireducens]